MCLFSHFSSRVLVFVKRYNPWSCRLTLGRSRMTSDFWSAPLRVGSLIRYSRHALSSQFGTPFLYVLSITGTQRKDTRGRTNHERSTETAKTPQQQRQRIIACQRECRNASQSVAVFIVRRVKSKGWKGCIVVWLYLPHISYISFVSLAHCRCSDP